jgi:hypothetical protein
MALYAFFFICLVADEGLYTEHAVELGHDGSGPAVRTPEQHIQIATYPRCLLDLLQREDCSFILCSIKSYKASIGLQASSLPEWESL